jgi:hypothetical protein
MLAAVLGPALTTTRAKLIVPLAVSPLGWLAVLLRLRSATALTLVLLVLTCRWSPCWRPPSWS